jgi:hypothetical protein
MADEEASMSTPEERLGFVVTPTGDDQGSLQWLGATQPQSVRPATVPEVRMWNMIQSLWPVDGMSEVEFEELAGND